MSCGIGEINSEQKVNKKVNNTGLILDLLVDLLCVSDHVASHVFVQTRHAFKSLKINL